ncbi:MAG TPA: ATP-binding cassette domain-containing protein [Phycisphaerae bacterium]|nr:ATP-binding cassette domain-containing protein [Phycisphaerae bacterium]
MIHVRDISLQAGTFVMEEVSLRVAPGEYFMLMGQTGSGKSLLIKTICGLVRPAAGSVHIDGQDVTRAEPRLRNIGYMPQDCGLFPHLNVIRNVVFSLRARGVGRSEAARTAQPLIDMLGIDHLRRRRCEGLSGGERQKVALARALAGEPKVLLLDEPVSALDEPTRREVCAELRQVQRHLGIATIHVCHSLEEARSVGDRVGIMHAGRVHQTGTVEELSANPRTDAVARLMNVAGPQDRRTETT